MSQYVLVTDDESQPDHFVELPTESDGVLLLSTVEAQFSGATGLKYRASSGAFRGLRVSDGGIIPPEEGWQDFKYVVVMKAPEAAKRRHDGDTAAPPAKQHNTGSAYATSADTDLIVLGLPWKATNDDVSEYFSQYGQLALSQVNSDANGRSKGFGFIRYTDPEVNKKVVAMGYHYVMGRRCEVKFPVKKGQEEFPRKLFIGCLTQEITRDDLNTYFESYGAITDTYLPQPFRGIAFVTFRDASSAMQCIENGPHVLNGVRLNVATPEPRKNDNPLQREDRNQQAATAAGQLTSQALLNQLALAASGGINMAALAAQPAGMVAQGHHQQQQQPYRQQQQQQQQQAHLPHQHHTVPGSRGNQQNFW